MDETNADSVWTRQELAGPQRRNLFALSTVLCLSSPMELLPTELLHLVLDLCAAEMDFKARQAVLCATALVAHRWRHYSQRLLWHRIELDSEDMGQKLLESAGSRRIPIGDLVLRLRFKEPELSAATARKIIERAPSIQILDMGAFQASAELDISTLSLPSLRGEESLFSLPLPGADFPPRADLQILLLNKAFANSTDAFPTSFPFRLIRLCLGAQHYSPHFVQALLASSTASLISLTFAVGETKPGYQALLEGFLSVASHLEDLGLWWVGTIPDRPEPPIAGSALVALLPSLATCHSLTSFRFVGYDPTMAGLSAVLSTIPSRLRHLATFTHLTKVEAFDEFRRCLELPVLKNLETWGVTAGCDYAQGSSAATGFFEVARKRGVAVLDPYS
jgi:hypothetical protein